MNIGERIKLRRLERGMTLEDVAKVVKVTRGTIQKYENSLISTIPYDKIILLSDALMVSPAYLMGWEEPEKPPQELTPKQLDLIEQIRHLTDAQVDALLTLLKAQSDLQDPVG